MSQAFLEKLYEGIIVFDGAMGTMLYSKGIYINRCFDELNLVDPNLVAEIHRQYIQAGADVIETNTFGTNRFKLASFGLAEKVREINIRGVQIAKEQIGSKNIFVAGSVGPLGQAIEPIGLTSRQKAKEVFQEQISALVEGGTDIIIIETISDFSELELAIQAAKQVTTELPIIAQVSFDETGRTRMGENAEGLVELGEKYQLPVIGTNCSLGPQGVLDIVKKIAPLTNIKISAQPNAGEPKNIEGRLIYLATPEYFAEYAKRLIHSGAAIVGGCCGTNPSHIRAIRNAVAALQPSKISVEKITIAEPKPVEKISVKSPAEKSAFGKKLSEGFAISVEMDPPRGIDPAKSLDSAKFLLENGVDVINIADGPRASARMSHMALAFLIKQRIGIEIILHYCCRDRNLLGMQADLIGANALGLRNILIITGDPPKLGSYPFATGVFDVDSIGLTKIAHNLNNGSDLAGNKLDEPTSLLIGVGADPGAINIDLEVERFRRKVAAGAEYVLTQPVFKTELLEDFLKHTTDCRIPTFVGILPLASYKNAEFLNNEVPGMSIPEPILERMRKADSAEAARKIGIEVAQQILRETKDMVQGAYIIPPFNRFEVALQVMEAL